MSDPVTTDPVTEPLTDPVVVVDDLAISYRAGRRDVTVVSGVSFALARGRVLGIVGESGSGKSTVARTLLGSLRGGSRVDAGTVTVLGDDVLALPEARLRDLRGRSVSLVAQNAGQALTPSMRVGDQVREALAVHGLPCGRDRVVELAELVRLPDPEQVVDRYPHELSGGQQQRIAIAMAVATDPQVLVLDEPTTALDVITQAAVLALVDDLRVRLGMAVLLVSHDLGVVSALADEVLVMEAGRVVESGPVAEVLTHPQQDYTRRLLDAAPTVRDDRRAATPLPVAVASDGADDVVLRCADLDVRYPRARRRAVEGFDLELRRGETVAVVGESGSGKSTVAAALAGLQPAESGLAHLRHDGADLDLLGPARRRPVAARASVQVVLQNADLALNPRRSVGSSIARPLRLFGRTRGRAATARAVADLLTEVGLDPSYADRVPGQLSGGQRQRVGIARALAAEPDVLVADEITTALDVSVQAEVLALLDRLRADRGLACLFISHDLAVVRRVAHRVVVMKDGLVVEAAPTAALFESPRHPYTRTLLDAVLEPGTWQLPAPDIDRRVPVPSSSAEMVACGEGHWVRADEGASVLVA